MNPETMPNVKRWRAVEIIEWLYFFGELTDDQYDFKISEINKKYEEETKLKEV